MWALVEMLIVPQLKLSETAIDIIKEIFLKIIIWLIPAAVLQNHFSKQMFVKKEEIYSFNKNCLITIPVFLLFTAYHFISNYTQNGKVELSSSFGIADIFIFASVGICEEMVFRGWFLNAALNKINKWIAVIINAVMFLLIHFPVWIKCGLFVYYNNYIKYDFQLCFYKNQKYSGLCIFTYVLGFALCYVLIK